MKYSFQWIKTATGFGYPRFYSFPEPSPGKILQSFGYTEQNKVTPEPPPLIDSEKSSSPPPPNVKSPASEQVETLINVESSTPSIAESTARVELDNTPATVAADSQEDFERIGKMAYSGTLVVVSVSMALLMSMPSSVQLDRIILYTCDATFACLSLLASIGLIYYSIDHPVGAELAWVQKRVMVISSFFVILAVFFRLAAKLPLLYFVIMLFLITVILGSVALYLYLARKKHKKIL